MKFKLTPAQARTVEEYGEKECLAAFAQCEVGGEGANTVGRGDTRLGDLLINAGRKIAARDGIDVHTHRDYRINDDTPAAVAADYPAAPVPGSVVFDCPGYQIVAADPNKKWVADEQFAIPFQSRHHGVLYHFFQLGSVVSYAMRYKQCPIAGLERAKANGHELHFAFALATIISDPPQAKRTVTGLNFGDVIEFEGRKFKLAPANNDNVRLVEVVS
jgi:hypothetical protein